MILGVNEKSSVREEIEVVVTSMHIVASVGKRESSKDTIALFSAGSLRFLAGAGCLNGSIPEALAHV